MARFFSNVLTERIISLINTNLKTQLGLKVVQKGTLEAIRNDPDFYNNWLPAIFVVLSNVEVNLVGLSQFYEEFYRYRLVYVKPFNTAEDYTEDKFQDTEQIAEMLVDNIKLGNLSLTNGQVIFSVINNIDYYPREEDELREIHGDIYASAIELTVKVTTQK